MAGALVALDIHGSVATLSMDDGKRNALSPAMFDELHARLERAEREGAAVVITEREGVLRLDLKRPDVAHCAAGLWAWFAALVGCQRLTVCINALHFRNHIDRDAALAGWRKFADVGRV